MIRCSTCQRFARLVTTWMRLDDPVRIDVLCARHGLTDGTWEDWEEVAVIADPTEPTIGVRASEVEK